MPAHRKMIFDEAALAHLKACRAQGLTLAQAARQEFRVKDETLRNYINESPFVEEVKRMYPRFGVAQASPPEVEPIGIQRIPLELLKKKPAKVPANPQAQWLARAWRSAA